MLKRVPASYSVIGVVVAVVAITLVADYSLSAGRYWDFGNGLGFAALAGLICLGLITPKASSLKVHLAIAYTTIVIVLLHALWFLLGDEIALQYILPGAPISMWAGILAFVLSIFLTVTALPSYRYRSHYNHRYFRHWHLWLSVLVMAATLYHIIGSGLYIRSWPQYVLLAIIALISFRGANVVRADSLSNSGATVLFIIASLLCAVLFTGVRSIAS